MCVKISRLTKIQKVYCDCLLALFPVCLSVDESLSVVTACNGVQLFTLLCTSNAYK